MEESKGGYFIAKLPLIVLVLLAVLSVALGIAAKHAFCENSKSIYIIGGAIMLGGYAIRYGMKVNEVLGGGFFTDAKDAWLKGDLKKRAKIGAIAPTLFAGAFLGFAKTFVFYVMPLIVVVVTLGLVFYC